MSELFANLGIQWKVLAAQIINFAILLFILSKFLYKPLIGLLNKRQEEISKAHAYAKEIDYKLSAIEEAKEAQIETARRESSELIKKAEANAISAAEKIISEAKADAERLSKEESVKIARDREKLIQETTKNLGQTIALAIEKTVGDVLDEKSKAKLAEQALFKIQNTR